MKVELHHGDCLEVLKTLDPNSFDCIVTDPPYGIVHVSKGSPTHGWGNTRLQDVVRNEWDNSTPSKELFDLFLSFGKPTVIWGGNYFPLPVSRGWLVWTKPERGFSLSEAELAWTSRDMPMRVWGHRRSDPDRTHPTQKPLGLMTWCMDAAKIPEGATVLDPFMGSGTTGVACVKTLRNFIGIERDENYFCAAKHRIEQAQAQGNLFDEAVF